MEAHVRDSVFSPQNCFLRRAAHLVAGPKFGFSANDFDIRIENFLVFPIFVLIGNQWSGALRNAIKLVISHCWLLSLIIPDFASPSAISDKLSFGSTLKVFFYCFQQLLIANKSRGTIKEEPIESSASWFRLVREFQLEVLMPLLLLLVAIAKRRRIFNNFPARQLRQKNNSISLIKMFSFFVNTTSNQAKTRVHAYGNKLAQHVMEIRNESGEYFEPFRRLPWRRNFARIFIIQSSLENFSDFCFRIFRAFSFNFYFYHRTSNATGQRQARRSVGNSQTKKKNTLKRVLAEKEKYLRKWKAISHAHISSFAET